MTVGINIYIYIYKMSNQDSSAGELTKTREDDKNVHQV